MPRNVLILGCGRSGTSIFGELFDSLPSIEYLEEPLAGDVPTDADYAIAVKVPRLGAGESAPPGCALSDEQLARVVPLPRVIFWQVRHPYDAVCSLRPGIADGWSHHPRPPDWEAWLDRPVVERCAYHWATINSSGYRQVADVAVVNTFEAMIENPLSAARDAVAAAGFDCNDVGAELEAWADRVRDKNDDRFVEARMSRRWSRPGHAQRVGRWRDDLTSDDCECIRPIVADGAAQFGYALDE